MSKRASPTVLGAFIVGGLLLIAVGLIVVGSRGLFAQKSKLVLYFPGSVNGLQVGSPVKFKGVTIGQVSSIKISLSTTDVAPHIPVVIEVDDNLIADGTGDPLDLSSPVLVRAMINKGIRASLEIESLLTGMLYVGLDVYTNAPPAVLHTPPGKYPEIPTVQTGLQKLAGSLPKVERILDGVESAANQLNTMLKQIQAGKINDGLVNALTDVQTLLRSPSITNAFVSIEKMADEFRGTASSLRGDLTPLIKQFSDTANAADQTLAEVDRVLIDTRRLLGDDSPMVSQLVSTLTEFQRMAVSLRQFADYLSRNPQAILTGRDLSNDSPP